MIETRRLKNVVIFIQTICKDLLEVICLVTINIWLNFLLEMNPYSHHILCHNLG